MGVAVGLGWMAWTSPAATPGSVDTTFNPGSGNRGGFVNTVDKIGDVTTLTVQADGRVLAGGVFNEVSTVARPGLARLLTDGALDLSLDPGSGWSGYMEVIAVDGEGRIVLGGRSVLYDGVNAPYLARAFPDGSPDVTFAPRPDFFVNDCLVLPDGRLLVAGGFETVAGVARSCVARLHADGSLDGSFTPVAIGVGQLSGTAGVFSVIVQPDGRIVIGGHFGVVGGVPRERIARLHPDGSLDTTFDAGAGGGRYEVVYDLELEPDGKILVGGWFEVLHGEPRRLLGRLLPDGSLDPEFAPAIDPTYGAVQSLRRQPDGKVVAAGEFETIGGVPRNGIARFHSDGSLDLGFDPGSGPKQDIKLSPVPLIRRIALQADGAVLVGGNFIEFDGFRINRLARLAGDCGGAVEWGQAEVAVGESQTQVDIPLVRMGCTDGPVTVGVGVRSSGLAVEGIDFTLSGSTVVFEAGQMSQTLTLSVPPGGMTGDDQIVALGLGNPVGGVLLGLTRVVEVSLAGRPSVEVVPPRFVSIEPADSSTLKLTVDSTSPGDYVLQRGDGAFQWSDEQTQAGPGMLIFYVPRSEPSGAVYYRVRR